MSTENKPEDTRITVSGPLPLLAASFDELHRQSKALAPSALIPKGLRGKDEKETLANVTLVLAYGREVGLGPIASLSGIAVVNGRPFAESSTLAALVRASGHCSYLRRTKSTKDSVTWETWRKGDPQPESRTFTMQDAQVAGLAGRDTYKAHPERMLGARALGWLLRDVYPDITKGLGTEAEREDAQDGYGSASTVVVAPASRGNAALKKRLEEKALPPPGPSFSEIDAQLAASRNMANLPISHPDAQPPEPGSEG